MFLWFFKPGNTQGCFKRSCNFSYLFARESTENIKRHFSYSPWSQQRLCGHINITTHAHPLFNLSDSYFENPVLLLQLTSHHSCPKCLGLFDQDGKDIEKFQSPPCHRQFGPKNHHDVILCLYSDLLKRDHLKPTLNERFIVDENVAGRTVPVPLHAPNGERKIIQCKPFHIFCKENILSAKRTLKCQDSVLA